MLHSTYVKRPMYCKQGKKRTGLDDGQLLVVGLGARVVELVVLARVGRRRAARRLAAHRRRRLLLRAPVARRLAASSHLQHLLGADSFLKMRKPFRT